MTHACNATQVDYYGASTPIRQLATVTAPAADALLIQPYDPATIVLIEKALSHSDLGMTPTNDGRCIRLRLPTLTKVRSVGQAERGWVRDPLWRQLAGLR